MNGLSRALAFERIYECVERNCVPSIDPGRVVEAVVRVAHPDLDQDLKAEARRIAGQTKRDGLPTRGV